MRDPIPYADRTSRGTNVVRLHPLDTIRRMLPHLDAGDLRIVSGEAADLAFAKDREEHDAVGGEGCA